MAEQRGPEQAPKMKGENHGEHELSQYEQEIMGLWVVAARVEQDVVQMKDYATNQIDMLPYFAPPP